jgi:4-hydroxybutyrate dehydrogenase
VTLHRFPGIADLGCGALTRLADHLGSLGASRPLIVTDEGVRRAGIVAKVEAALGAAGFAYAVFDRVRPNPGAADVDRAFDTYREEACDGLVGVGGGSVLDTAKLVRVLDAHGGNILDYRSAAGGWGKIGSNLPPMVALPTTAGTGSEVTLGAVLTDADRNAKIWIGSPGLFPNVALVDPELTVGSPPRLTASAGVDVLVHGVEAYAETSDAPFADLLARDAIELTVRNLPLACQAPGELRPREAMSRAALEAGLAFGWKGLGAAHALGHQVTTEAGVPHGFAVAMLLPNVMHFNLPVSRERYAELAPALGADSGEGDGAEAAIRAVERLNATLEVPARLSDVGIGEAQLAGMVARALEDGTLPTNPRPCSEDDLMAIYREAL